MLTPLARLLIGIGGLAAVLLLAGIWLLNVKHKAKAEGRTEVTTQVQGKVIDDVAAAHKAIEAAATDPAIRNAECLRHSRTPENCQ